MNNALIKLDDEPIVPSEHLMEREAKLVRLIEAYTILAGSSAWSTLKDELFIGALESIENRIRVENEKPELNIPELYRLQGEKKWAKRYASPETYVETLRAELAHIRKINPPAERDTAPDT